MADLHFFSIKDKHTNNQPSRDPLDVAVVDVSRYGKAPFTYLAAMLLDTSDGNGLMSRVFEITESEIRKHFIEITPATARAQNGRVYAFARGVFAWQPDGKAS